MAINKQERNIKIKLLCFYVPLSLFVVGPSHSHPGKRHHLKSLYIGTLTIYNPTKSITIAHSSCGQGDERLGILQHFSKLVLLPGGGLHGVTVLRVLSLRFRGGLTVLRVLSLAARSAAGKFWDLCVPMPGKEYIFARRDCAEGLGLGLRVLRF